MTSYFINNVIISNKCFNWGKKLSENIMDANFNRSNCILFEWSSAFVSILKVITSYLLTAAI